MTNYNLGAILPTIEINAREHAAIFLLSILLSIPLKRYNKFSIYRTLDAKDIR